MSKNRKAFGLVLSILFAQVLSWPLLSRAADRKPLSVEEAVALGLEASPGLHASRARTESASARARELQAARLPSLKFGGGYARLSEVPPFEVTLPISPNPIVVSQNYFNSYTLRLGVQQPLFTGFRLEAGAEAARMLEKSAGLDLERDRLEFAFTVKSAYWALARAIAFEKAVAENIDQVTEQLKDVRAFYDQGLLTRNEVLRAELQLSNARLMLIDTQNAIDVARTSLNSLIGWPLETEIELTTTAESLAASLPVEEKTAGGTASSLIQTALSDRADLRSADLRIKSSEAGVKAAKAAWYPQVLLTGNYYYYRPNPRLMPAQDKFYGSWDIGISLSLDIWNWGQTRSQTIQAEAQLAQARDSRKLLGDQVSLEVIQSRLAVKQAREKTSVAREAVVQAEENLRITRERFRQGVALNRDVLDAEIELLQAKTNRTQAAIDLVLAQARLEKALGH
jgi:outer membrane protein